MVLEPMDEEGLDIVCSYDRTGLGENESVEGVPTAQVASDRLH